MSCPSKPEYSGIRVLRLAAHLDSKGAGILKAVSMALQPILRQVKGDPAVRLTMHLDKSYPATSESLGFEKKMKYQ